MSLDFVYVLGAADGLPMSAPPLWKTAPIWLTNSMVVSVVVAIALIAFAQYATRNISLVPGKAQNFWEIIIEKLSGILEGILGWKLLRDTFWFFASIFIFIIACNLQALIPGVGTVGSYFGPEDFSIDHVHIPYMRGANADVNMTLAMSAWFMVLWIYWAFKYNGAWGFVVHIFGPKAKLSGILGVILFLVFIFVGAIEVLSILIRPVALTFRLYGNIYGGEAMIHEIEHMAGHFAFLALIPVYIFELLVAVVQALVFCLLTAAFTALMCRHDESHDAHGAHGSAEHGGAH
jgi:F-type H+-transporting ATPase subunit a